MIAEVLLNLLIVVLDPNTFLNCVGTFVHSSREDQDMDRLMNAGC